MLDPGLLFPEAEGQRSGTAKQAQVGGQPVLPVAAFPRGFEVQVNEEKVLSGSPTRGQAAQRLPTPR